LRAYPRPASGGVRRTLSGVSFNRAEGYSQYVEVDKLIS
jgi:hypothetical protein